MGFLAGTAASIILLLTALLSSVPGILHLVHTEPPAPSATAPTGAVASSSTDTTTLQNASPGATSAASSELINKGYGFEISYPSSYLPNSNSSNQFLYDYFFPDGTVILDSDSYSTLLDAEISVEVGSDASSLANCMRDVPQDSDVQIIGTTTINGVAFFAFDYSRSLAGSNIDESWHKTIHDNICFAIVTTASYKNDTSRQYRTRVVQAESELRSAVASFQFITKSDLQGAR